MKSVLILIICMHLPGRAMFAQTSADSVDHNSKAIYFYLINQVALTYQSQLSHDLFWTISADVSGSKSSQTEERDPVTGSTQDVKDESFAIRITPQILWHYDLSGERIRFFFGLGPTIRYSHTYRHTEYTDNSLQQPRHDEYTDIHNVWDGGIQMTSGLEVKMTELLSVSAKYDLSGTYGKETWHSDYPSTPSQELIYRRWNLQLSQVRIGVGVNF
jgi:hypothetical protein